MTKALTAFLLVFTLFFGASSVSAAPAGADDEARFFVQTGKGLMGKGLRNLLGVRHEFADGFTTDSSAALVIGKISGANVFPVQRLNILPDAGTPAEPAADAADPQGRGQGGKPDKSPTPTPEPSASPRPAPTGQVPWGVALVLGSSGAPSGGASVSIAVLDTGVYTGHPDLSRRIAACRDYSQRKAPVVEDKCDDDNGHGTHVAGIVAADGGEDGLGIFGVAPAADILAYKVCGKSGSCWSDDIATAIRHAADNGAHIVTMSLGSDAKSSLIADAVAYAAGKGVLIIAAAGNDGPYDGSIDYPGALAEVIAVGAVDVEGAVAEWSSRGVNSTTEPYVTQEGDIELVAPGVNIESTFKDGGYAILSGTSMAAPHIAGLAALGWQFGAEHEAGETRDWLHGLAADIAAAGDDDASGWGLCTL
ncbi:MAG TPA: S8 family peptidase [Candidatus Paceibacterota bacterium]|nr:S8 family peptidase [Candidatus Paceibacterota bacterium]